MHRLDGPAVIWGNDSKEWFFNGKRHREDGPAGEWADGRKEWYLNGQRHREGGPAVEYPGGRKEWARAGYPYSISASNTGIHIGRKVKATIQDWDDWITRNEEFEHKRNSKEFAALLELWEQFKEQYEP